MNLNTSELVASIGSSQFVYNGSTQETLVGIVMLALAIIGCVLLLLLLRGAGAQYFEHRQEIHAHIAQAFACTMSAAWMIACGFGRLIRWAALSTFMVLRAIITGFIPRISKALWGAIIFTIACLWVWTTMLLCHVRENVHVHRRTSPQQL